MRDDDTRPSLVPIKSSTDCTWLSASPTERINHFSGAPPVRVVGVPVNRNGAALEKPVQLETANVESSGTPRISLLWTLVALPLPNCTARYRFCSASYPLGLSEAERLLGYHHNHRSIRWANVPRWTSSAGRIDLSVPLDLVAFNKRRQR